MLYILWNHQTNLYIATKVVVLSLGSSVAINPGYGSISFEHGSNGVATTESKPKVLDNAEKEEGERERKRENFCV